MTIRRTGADIRMIDTHRRGKRGMVKIGGAMRDRMKDTGKDTKKAAQ